MAMVYELGEVMAERELEAVTRDGGRTPVVVKLGTPHPDPLGTGEDWCCPHQILGLGDENVLAAFGVDSLQAFLMATRSLKAHLAERSAAASVTLTWLGQPHLGRLNIYPEPE
ncbi:DUF6968 family protein [Streptomyces tubercidicus]|uniref:DUF6968 domain-containing protein n=1 Tax=Streptomyces tubercidicus TaxID=47759 RepID=A0A640UYD6_9ACTN|nr:hypothetical protein [Streptomyces tubercidicus]WAU13398.1 hypothetical protein STRTU_003893 [Streptomyces tubercidicus]GFE38996.1 hypothetical protein Stube_36690 [Streptomyces tubercidicus]